MRVIVIDAGTSIIKAKIARQDNGEIAFPHAFQQLTENEYQKILSRATTKGLYRNDLRVNGMSYVIIESAKRHDGISQKACNQTRMIEFVKLP